MFESLVIKCSEYYWQGNIRQLFYVLNTWYALCDGELDVKLLPCVKTMHAPQAKESAPGQITDQLADVIDAVERAIFLDVSLTSALESVEKYILKHALELHPSIRDVYEGLDISRNNLYFKRRRYGLTYAPPPSIAMGSHPKFRSKSGLRKDRLPPPRIEFGTNVIEMLPRTHEPAAALHDTDLHKTHQNAVVWPYA